MTKKELEEKISVLLSCKNCPENKGGFICQKEYEDKCLAQKIQYIKELQEEIKNLKKTYRKQRNKRIDDLQKENAELEKENKVLAQNLEDTEILNKTYEKRFDDLEKENAELKKNYEDSLVACGVLKNKVELLSQPSPIESMQDALITTQKAQNEKQNADILTLKGLTERQRDQLIKAKEIISEFMKYEINEYDGSLEIHFEELKKQAEQFISEVEK